MASKASRGFKCCSSPHGMVWPNWFHSLDSIRFNSSAHFAGGSKKRKPSNDDECGHGQEKRRPTTLCWRKKVRLCDMSSKYLCVVRTFWGWMETYLNLARGGINISNIVPVFPEGYKNRKSSNDDEDGHGQENKKNSTLWRRKKVRLCDMSFNSLCVVRVVWVWTETYLNLARVGTNISNIVPAFPGGIKRGNPATTTNRTWEPQLSVEGKKVRLCDMS